MNTTSGPCFLALVLCSLLPALHAPAAPGDLDISFGINGVVTGNISSIALQNDGRIVAAGDGKVYRFLASGVPDLTFGGAGFVKTPMSISGAGRAVAVQSDGMVVAVGTVNGQLGDVGVIRFKADGTVDNSFGGNGTGIASQNITIGGYRYGMDYYYEPSDDTGVSVTVLNDGRIVAVGTAFYKNSQHRPVGMGIIIFNTDGSFGGSYFRGLGNGDAAAPAYAAYGYHNGGRATSVVAGPDGGYATSAWSIHSGSVTEVFPLTGPSTYRSENLLETFPFELPYHDECYAVAYSPKGELVSTGVAQVVSYSNYPFLSGWYVFFLNNSTPTGTGLEAGRCITVQPDDRILVGGGNLIRRFMDSNTMDPSFQISTGISANFRTLLMQPDGKLLAAGGGIWRFETGVTYPEIAVEQPSGNNLTDGAAVVALGTVPVGTPVSRTFRLTNPSATPLRIHRIYFDGTAAAQFRVSGQPGSVPAQGEATFTMTYTPSVPAPAAAAMHIVSNDYDENWFDLNLTGTGKPVGPEIAVEQPVGTLLTDAAATVEFTPGGAPVSFTLRSIGTGDLTGITISSGGVHPRDFIVVAPPPASLSPDESAAFTIAFAPTATGRRTATLHIASNDADENPFDINLTGYQPTLLETWRITHFGSPDNTGPAADLADPDGDGLVNLMEFAVAANPHTFTAPIGTLVKNGATLEYTYSRPTAAVVELNYQLQASITLSGVWSNTGVTSTILSDDGITQVVKATAPAGSLGKRYVRLRVTRL